MTRIDTLAQWQDLSALMAKHGYYTLYRQYRVTDPEGAITCFRTADPALRDIEVVTFDAEVDKAISEYR